MFEDAKMYSEAPTRYIYMLLVEESTVQHNVIKEAQLTSFSYKPTIIDNQTGYSP